jgi:hypothetical protein
MAEKGSHAIRNSVIASVAAGLILAAVPTVRGWAVAGLTALASWVQQLWQWLVSTYETPAWLLLVLTLFSAAFVIPRTVGLLRRSREPTHRDSYATDRLFGAVWRWRYVYDNVANLWCFCPACDNELVYSEGRNDGMQPRAFSPPDWTSFTCDRCNVERCKLEGNKDFAVEKVEREIRRKIRTGEWNSRELRQ